MVFSRIENHSNCQTKAGIQGAEVNFVYVFPESEETRCTVERRCTAPARAINRTGRYNADLISWRDFIANSHETQSLLEQSDFIIIHRGLWSPLLPVIQHWKARDKNIIADFVNAYQLMDEDELADYYDFETKTGIDSGKLVKGSPSLITQFKWTLQSISGATTPSQRLCDDWSAYTRMAVLPDYLDMERLSLIAPQNHEGMVIGWRGSVRQLQMIKKSGVMMALEAACQMRRNLHLIFSVDHPESVPPLSLPANQVELVGWTQNGGWNSVLSNIDIGIAPMIGESGQREDCSSILEYMALQIPWIASQGPAIYDYHGFGWIVENTAESWLKAIIEVVDHYPDFRAEAAVGPYLFAISKSLEENIQTVVDTYVHLTGSYSTRPLNPVSKGLGGKIMVASENER
jgi:glycosyltransferase involved in cell wall biosynthesis